MSSIWRICGKSSWRQRYKDSVSIARIFRRMYNAARGVCAKMRKYVAVLCLFAFVLCLSACGSYRYSQNCDSELEGVAMYTEKAAYAPDVSTINVVWKNHSSRELTFGNMFYLEKQTDAGWERIGDGDSPVVFTSIGYPVLPIIERKHSYDIRAYADSLETGTYRILTSFSDVGSSGVPLQYSLSVEFNVV